MLAEIPKGKGVAGTCTADIADSVLPGLTAAMSLPSEQVPAEADNFRRNVLVACEAAQTRQSEPTPATAETTRKFLEALDAT
ncbi:hypothetical protein [Streptomyces sp. CdTB01]|uniref:hypothetical protein n=1 Tax=Streptomyces sp. CdTB01 TaxID=1725411 RepID=UPI00131ED211|nr:hypothetical protein [Streptomyces sp. CdTB01]